VTWRTREGVMMSIAQYLFHSHSSYRSSHGFGVVDRHDRSPHWRTLKTPQTQISASGEMGHFTFPPIGQEFFRGLPQQSPISKTQDTKNHRRSPVQADMESSPISPYSEAPHRSGCGPILSEVPAHINNDLSTSSMSSQLQ
jgi:hypothetical protein